MRLPAVGFSWTKTPIASVAARSTFTGKMLSPRRLSQTPTAGQPHHTLHLSLALHLSLTTLMRLLTRYILREVSSHALLGGVLFTFVLFIRDLGKILELVVRDSATVTQVAGLVAYTLPNAFTVTIPMAILVGILLGLSRLAADSEITAMRASGMGAFDFVRIVSLVSLLGLALGLVNSIVLAPHSARSLLALDLYGIPEERDRIM